MKLSTIKPPLITIFTITLSLLFLSHQSFGQGFPLTIKKDGLVFEGHVSSKKGLWSADKSTIYTINWFKPSSIYAGNLEVRDSIPVLTKGGLTTEGYLS